MEALEPGTLLSDRYELREPIGSGAMGEVYRAWDREAGREVALKWLRRRDPDDLFRLKHEFRSLARIVHPNLLRLYELVVEGSRCFFTAELIEGGRDLVSWLTPVAPEAREAAVRGAFQQLARGLAALHAQHKVHRDLKPANVLVDPTGHLVLLDFGLVGEVDAEMRDETPGALVGTFAYMSPEQSRGAPLTPASDWYSVGVLLYECLAGASPFAEATRLELADRRWLRIPPLAARAPDAPADLARLATALLALDPAGRPGAAEILSVLDPDGGASAASPPRSPGPFVGRDAELRQLAFAYATVRTGEPYALTVSGPSGIGKTGLVEHFLATLPPGEALVLRARCHPQESVPFAALDEAIDGLTRHLLARPPERIAALAPRDVDALLTVFPVLGRVGLPAPPAPSGTEPHLLRRRGFRALRELLATLAEERPLVVWLDDVQWADPDSAPLLRELLRPPSLPSVLWILAHREDEREDAPLRRLLDELPALVGEASRDAVALQPLPAAESRALVAALAGGAALGAAQLAAMADEGAGSPFLLGELAHSAASAAPVPAGTGYARVLESRLAGLSAPARCLVETLAVAAAPLERRTALDAADLGTFDPDLVAGLERTRLLRTSGGRRGSLEIYHARIQETLVAGLAPEARRERHAALADAMERRHSDDLRALYEHHRGAGRGERAAVYAFRAAEQAAAQLAFDHAAQLYRAALELAPDAVDRGRALQGQAEALANAGRGRDAAHAFAAAAAHAAAEGRQGEAVRLRCSAAEQHLVSGHLHEGVAVLAPLLDELGLRYPATTRAAFAATFASLPALALRYVRPRPAPPPLAAGTALLAIDAYHTAAKGLVVVDPARAAYFSVRSLIASLEDGDPLRRGRAYNVVGAAIVPLGAPLGAWGRRMLERARRLALDTGDPYLEGMAAISQAQVSCVAGRWSEMLRLCDAGTRRLRADCRGARWECDVGNMAAVRALEELGRIPELEQRLAGLLEEAQALDDLYAEVTFRLYAAFWSIPRGESARARREANDTVARWSGEGFQLQHLYELRIQAFCDLYEGDPEAAWRRVEAAWPALRRSNLLVHLLLRSDALAMRARVALAFAAQGAGRGGALRTARRAARALARIGRADAVAAAALLRAGIARRRGDRARAQSLAEDAAARFEAAEMPLHAAQARLCAALDAEDSAARSLRDAARADLLARHVADPERWLRVAAPGFEDAARA